jgi:hypothetical protein
MDDHKPEFVTAATGVWCLPIIVLLRLGIDACGYMLRGNGCLHAASISAPILILTIDAFLKKYASGEGGAVPPRNKHGLVASVWDRRTQHTMDKCLSVGLCIVLA